MSILQPLALLGLLTLPIIILLHLLRERSKRAVVPSLELWRWLEKEVRGPRFRRIPLTWILLLQLLAAVLLTLALVQPQLPALSGSGRGQRLILVVDVSASMGAVDVVPNRLAQAQARAAGLLGQLRGSDSVAVISAGPSARTLADSAQVGLAEVASQVAGLTVGGIGSDWEGALALAAAAVLPERVNRIVVFTDGALHWPEHLDTLRLPARIEWYRIGGAQSNQAVLNLSARPAASGAVQVFAQIANFSNSPARREVTLSADGRVVDQNRVELAPSGLLSQAWTLPPGTATVAVSLAGNDALASDDSAWVGVMASRPVDTLLVSNEPATLERALQSQPGVRLTVVSPAAYQALDRPDLTVFHKWLPEDWPAGAVLVVDPQRGSELLPVLGPETRSELELTRGDALLADVDLEPMTLPLRTSRLGPTEWLAPVLSTVSGTGLIWRGAVSESRVVVLSFSVDSSDTNLVRRPAFPVLVANIMADLLPPPLPPSVPPGTGIDLPSTQSFPILRVTTPSGQVRNLGAERDPLFGQTHEPGLYLFDGLSAGGEQWQAAVGVNVGDAHESDLRRSVRPALAQSAGAVDASGPPRPFKLWPLAVVLALVVLLVEARLAWR
jgi:Ca-activated chloride channel homolog